MKKIYKGWMLFCPVYMTEVETNEPIVAARWLILEPLLSIAHFVQSLIITLSSYFNEEYEPHFYFKITGEVNYFPKK